MSLTISIHILFSFSLFFLFFSGRNYKIWGKCFPFLLLFCSCLKNLKGKDIFFVFFFPYLPQNKLNLKLIHLNYTLLRFFVLFVSLFLTVSSSSFFFFLTYLQFWNVSTWRKSFLLFASIFFSFMISCCTLQFVHRKAMWIKRKKWRKEEKIRGDMMLTMMRKKVGISSTYYI